MDVAVADDRLAVPRGEALGGAIEVDAADEHRIALDGVEQIRMPLQIGAQADRRRKKRMRRHHEPGRCPEPGEISEVRTSSAPRA